MRIANVWRRLGAAALMVAAAAACHRGPAPGDEPSPDPAQAERASPREVALRPGDRIVLFVENERALSDTFTVRPGPAVELPVVGTVSLADVPPSQVEARLTAAISRVVRRPTVHARPLVRIGVLGEVARPGFYAVAPDAVVADALASAGGPLHTAHVDGARVERDGHVIVASSRLRRALATSVTLGQLGVASGDQLVVPPARDTERLFRIIAVLVTIPAAIIAVANHGR